MRIQQDRQVILSAAPLSIYLQRKTKVGHVSDGLFRDIGATQEKTCETTSKTEIFAACSLPDGRERVEALGNCPREPLGLDLLLQVPCSHING